MQKTMNDLQDLAEIELHNRVRKLTPDQRSLLAQRLGLGAQSSAPRESTERQIVAWVKTERDSPNEPVPDRSDYRRFLRERVPDYMLPARIEAVSSIPRLSNGKVDRIALRSMLPLRSTALTDEGLSHVNDERFGEMIDVMSAIWADVLGLAQVRSEDDFFELGGDSLKSITVVARAAERDLMLKPADLFDFPKLGELCAHILEESRESRKSNHNTNTSSLRSRNLDGSRPPLFMVHGGSRLLARLRDALGAEQPIHLLSAHWEEADLAHDTSLDKLAEDALEVLLDIQPDGPYRLGGYSFGAVIAFELARLLAQRGEVVDMLFMLDPPENPGIFASVPESCRHLQRQRDATATQIDGGSELRDLDPADAARQAIEKGRNHFGHYASRLRINARYAYALACVSIGRPVPAELRKLYVFRRYLAAARRYDLRSVSSPVLLYRARRGYHKYGPALWLALAEGGITLVEFDCEHDDLQWNPDTVEEWTNRFAAQFTSAGAAGCVN